MSAQKKGREPPASMMPATATTILDHDILAAARTRIDAAATILTGFHLRHKNQHRVSTYWWPALGQLRRHVRRIGNDLAMADKAAAGVASAVTRTKQAAKGVRSPAALVLARARWIRLHFVPKAYVAFSRLVADRQFAPLGLLLMGVLAQVHAVVRGLDAAAGSSASAADRGAVDSGAKRRSIPANHNSADSESGKDDDDNDDDNDDARPRDADTIYRPSEPAADVGVAVPREEDSRLSDNADAGEAARSAAVPSAAKRRKGERPGEDPSLAATTAATAGDALPEKSEKKERKEAKAKAKAKKRKRDEFDDLFNGLM